MSRNNSSIIGVVIIALSAGIFTLDVITPLGISNWVWYFIPLLLSVFIDGRWLPFWLAAGFSALTMAGWYLSPPGVDPEIALISRGMGLGGLCIMAVTLSLRNRMEQERTEYLRQITEMNESLAALNTVTANSISTLELDDLLKVLLERLVNVMKADGAVVLLRENNCLVARASIGCEADVEAGYSVPIGRGFAGTIAQTRQPLFIADAQTDERVLSPHFKARGIRSMLGVALGRNGRFVGVLHVDWLKPHPLQKQEVHLLEIIAERCCAGIFNAQLFGELKRSEDRYERLFAASPDAILVNRENKIAFINPAGLKLFGAARPEELLGKSMFEVFHPQDHPVMVERIARMHGEGAPAPLIEEKVLRLDGTPVPVEVRATPFMDNEGQAILVILRNIAERRLLEEQLRRAQKMEAFGQLAGGVAHDFNNLLAVIRGNTDLMLMEGGTHSGETAQCLEEVAAASDCGASLVRRLLLFSRKQAMQAEPLNLNNVAGNLSKMLHRTIGEDIELHCSYSPTLPFIQADAGMMDQIILNLVVNARDAMPDGGELHLATDQFTLGEEAAATVPDRRPGKYVCLSVRDTGCGIAPEVLPRIFEPFFTTKEVGKGTGLGLATVYGIAKQHQGWVEVASQVGEGATFKIFLPAMAEPAPVPAEASASSKPRGGSEKILLVEDEESVRLVIRRFLEKAGYMVWEAVSGREALEIFQKHSAEIDLVMTDLVMPGGVNGLQLAEQLRAQRPELKFIFISGYSVETGGKNMILTIQRSKGWYLQKPSTAAKVLQTVRDCLDAKG